MTRLPLLITTLALVAAACAPAAGGEAGLLDNQDTMPGLSQSTLHLPDDGPAPELTNSVWLNTPDGQPLRLAGLRGKVVAIDFWTFG